MLRPLTMSEKLSITFLISNLKMWYFFVSNNVKESYLYCYDLIEDLIYFKFY